MRLRFLLFVVFYIIWVMAALFIVFGLFTVGQEPGVIPFPAIVVYFVVIMLPLMAYNRWGLKPLWARRVLTSGKTAYARVVSVEDTGMLVNNYRIVRVRLHVQPSDESPFEATLENTWSTRPYEGQTLQVKYDPRNKKHVTLLSGSPAQAKYPRGAELDPELQALYDQETAEEQNGKPATGSSSGIDIGEELYKLAKLHENGDLSDAEFERAKQKLLG